MVTSEELINHQWYPVVNDMVGGWAVSTHDKPLSQHDFSKGDLEVADFCSKEVAWHIVHLHNVWLSQRILKITNTSLTVERDLDHSHTETVLFEVDAHPTMLDDDIVEGFLEEHIKQMYLQYPIKSILINQVHRSSQTIHIEGVCIMI